MDKEFKVSPLNGLKMENHLIKQFGLSASTKRENIEDDIDAWDYMTNTAISVKTQHTAMKTGNLAFEFKLYNDDTLESMDSWLHTGKSHKYWIVIGDTVYVFDTKEIKEFILEHKDVWRKTRLTNKQLIGINAMQGRKFNQSMCYLVPMKKLEHLVEQELFVEV